jgi:anti-sigma factor RsiW
MHGHLDGELDLVADLEVQRHIEECPRCASEYAALRAMRTRLKDEEFRFEAPAELREKIRRAVAASPQTRSAAPQRSGGYKAQRRPWVPRAIRFAIPMAVGAMLALVLAPRMIAPTLDQRLASEVVASHVRSLMATHLMDVASTDQHTVKPWFNGRLDFSPPVNDFAKDGFPLVGGRLDYINGRQVAALVYQHGKHVINVFMWPSAFSTTNARRIETEHGYNVVQLIVAGMNCWVVSDLNQQELAKFAGLLSAKG